MASWVKQSWLLLLLLTGCISAPNFVSGEQSPLLAYFESKEGRITYVGVDGNIYVNDQSGSNELQITTDARLPTQNDNEGSFRYYQFPTWARDSQQLAFVGLNATTQQTESAALYTTSLGDGSEAPTLTEIYNHTTRFPFYLYWSPDNENVTFLSSAANSQMMLQLAAANGERTQVLDVGQPIYWSWAPDGQQLLMHINGATGLERLSFLAVGGTIVEQGLAYGLAPFQAPAWSPDGSHIVLGGETDTAEKGILLTDNEGRLQKMVEPLAENQTAAFGWSPTSEQFAYILASNPDTGLIGPLVVQNVGENGDRLTVDELVAAFFWAPDGNQLAYFVPQQPEQQSSGGESPPLVLSLRLLDVSSGSKTTLATFQPTPAFVNMIAFFDQYQQSATIWSPDSKNLVVSGFYQSPNPEILIVSTESNLQPRAISNGLMAYWSWR